LFLLGLAFFWFIGKYGEKPIPHTACLIMMFVLSISQRINNNMSNTTNPTFKEQAKTTAKLYVAWLYQYIEGKGQLTFEDLDSLEATETSLEKTAKNNPQIVEKMRVDEHVVQGVKNE